MSSTKFFHQGILNSSLKRFKEECKLQENKLLGGQCQLCIDGLLLLVPHSTNQIDEIITPNPKCSLETSGGDYLLQLVRKCPYVKIVYPPDRPFRGFVDLSLFESCKALELIRIPFHRICGEELLRQNLRSLIWIRGNRESLTESINWSVYRDNDSYDKPLRIDEIFWDEFGMWPSLTYLCLARSNITLINASTMPQTIDTFDVRNNRVCHFNNLANYSWTNSITKLCLEYNSLRELPKLNANTLSTLVYLSLHGNLLETIAGLRNFNSLDYLDISENSITDSRNFLHEISFLSTTLKTLFVDKNPISFDPKLRYKCEGLLCRLVIFNGTKTKRRIRIMEEPMVPAVDALHSLERSINRFDSSMAIEIESKDDEKVMIKSKPSKERFVVINDDHDYINTDDGLIADYGQPTTSMDKIKMKNYFFGGISGSYGSSVNNLQQRTKNFDEIREDNLGIIVEPLANTVSIPETENMGTQNQSDNQPGEIVNKPEEQALEASINLSEWASEDTEDNTMFLVEIYSNIADYDQNLLDESNVCDYYFVKIRPRDGLIFEKDCTSGKVLQTLDLKILERYECLNDDNLALKLYFDTCIVAKKERIYRFLDEKSFQTFVDMFLSKHNDYRQQYLDSTGDPQHNTLLSLQNQSSSSKNLPSKTDANSHNNKFTSPWFYMCLRCGQRTHRIITDCPKCGSELIIRDESFQNPGGENQSKIMSNLDMIPTNANAEESMMKNDEETIDDYDVMTLDENFFRSNIDHYLKLHIEIYIYEKLAKNEMLKSESVEALFHCLIYDSTKKSFQLALAVLTNNYFFLFDHSSQGPSKGEEEISPKKNSLYGSSSKDQNDKKDLVSLIFYTPLASEQSPPLIISHLPEPMKNVGYWLEVGLDQSLKKILATLRPKKKQQKFLLELILFSDAIMGKAFLEMLFKFQKACLRSNLRSKPDHIPKNDRNLIIVKSSITKLIDEDDQDSKEAERFKLVLDETCQSMLMETFDDGQPTKIANMARSPFSIFVLESFQYLQNLNQTLPNQSIASTSFNNLFTINENIVLVVVNDYLIIGELYCIVQKICSTYKSNQNQPLAKILKQSSASSPSIDDFHDRIEIKTLFKELIINLLPNIYLDKSKFLLVLRFREDDDLHSHTSSSEKHRSATTTGSSTGIKNQQKLFSIETPTEQASQSNLLIYEFKLKFLSLNSLIQTCRMICDSWERNFGISLTISKYQDEDQQQ